MGAYRWNILPYILLEFKKSLIVGTILLNEINFEICFLLDQILEQLKIYW